MVKRLILISISITLLLSVHCQTLQAAAPGIKTSIGYGGYTVPGRWAPVRIQLNGASDNFQVELSRPDQDYSIVESFSCDNRYLIESAVFPGEPGSKLRVSLIQDGIVLSKQSIDLSSAVFPGHLILTVGLGSSWQHFLKTALFSTESVLVVPVQLNQLPVVALNYDSVSCLVMKDPGPVLNPAQITALRSWLTGGGCLVIGQLLSGEKSLIGQLVKLPDKSSLNRETIQMGLGKILLLPDQELEQSSAKKDYWREKLALKPYLESFRLTPGQIFSEINQPIKKTLPSPKFTEASPKVGLILICWGVVAWVIVLRVKYRPVLLLIIYSIIAAVVMYLTAGWVSSIWQRGAFVQHRLVILPETGIGWVNSRVELKQGSAKILGYNSSPWGARLTADNRGAGLIQPLRKTVFWKHQKLPPNLLSQSGNGLLMDLVGVISLNQSKMSQLELVSDFTNTKISSLPQSFQEEIYLWDRGELFTYQPASANGEKAGRRKIIPPDWFAADQEWLLRLGDIYPELIWLIGRGVLPDYQVAVQGGKTAAITWVMPVLKGEE